jgi:hypothetical protein
MNAYTVVVLYPQRLADDYPRMTNTAAVQADDPIGALSAGAKQAWEKQPAKDRGTLADWLPLVVFDGHLKPAAYGW